MLEILAIILSLLRPARILRWTVFLLAVASLWLMVENATLQRYFEARERRNNYLEQVRQLQHREEHLLREEAALKEGGFAAEKIVRERFDMIRPGEKVIYIETPDTKAADGSTPARP